MKVCGIQKTSLVDYPGHMATVIFTGGCNFNCPYCHNSQLIDPDVEAEYSVGETLDILEKRKNLIDAVAISGGEPTLQPDLHAFISKVKAMGFKVKLDTNGSNPDVLKKLIDDSLLDYVAMDVKDVPEYYKFYSKNKDVRISNIDRSVRYLIESGIEYEFRTTATLGLHTYVHFEYIGRWIEGAENYYIQNFRESDSVMDKDLGPFNKECLEKFADAVRPYVKNVYIRGV